MCPVRKAMKGCADSLFLLNVPGSKLQVIFSVDSLRQSRAWFQGHILVCGRVLKSILTLFQATEGSSAANIYEAHTMMMGKIVLGTDYRAHPRTVFLNMIL